MVTLIKFSESDKKILLILLIIILLFIIVFGYLQKLVAYIMRKQGLAVDTMMYDILRTGVIKKKGEFKKEAYRKSMVLFTKKAWIPFLIIAVSVLAILIFGWAKGENGLSYYPEAWSSLTFDLDWPTNEFFGLTIVSDWPSIVKYPDFSWSIDKYYALFFTLIGAISALFYLYQVQAYLARAMRIRRLGRTYFSKDLEKQSNQQIAQ
ncbi:MAG: hypothetical protein IAC78_01640 [Firmicutes bacterium]|uniref:Uncharacterized protein n=1 Tax=Candidatus Scatoplasma merdavium TaxID=2840932 RepID=A0A9D9GRF8_9BACL|nr:hypothetical protein [Candidatus Scatoplasma merdavium]